MKRSILNFILDGVSLVVMLSLIGTGLVMRFVLPPGTGGLQRGEPHKLLWGLGRHDWGAVHFWLAAAILVLMIIHVALHWTWICNLVRQLVRRPPPADVAGWHWQRNLYGIGTLLVVLGLIAGFLAIAFAAAEDRPGVPGHRRAPGAPAHRRTPDLGQPAEPRADDHARSGAWIQGWMTLSQASQTSGVPVEYIIEKLGLPADTPADEQLGRLRRRYGFQMEDVRRVIAQYPAPQAEGQ